MVFLVLERKLWLHSECFPRQSIQWALLPSPAGGVDTRRLGTDHVLRVLGWPLHLWRSPHLVSCPRPINMALIANKNHHDKWRSSRRKVSLPFFLASWTRGFTFSFHPGLEVLFVTLFVEIVIPFSWLLHLKHHLNILFYLVFKIDNTFIVPTYNLPLLWLFAVYWALLHIWTPFCLPSPRGLWWK